MEIRYPALLTPEGTGYTVRFVDLEEAFTEGETLDEALFNAAEVLALTLEGRIEEGMAIPAPSAGVEGARYVAPDVKTQAAVLVHLARGERTLADLARALETSWAATKRLEDTHHWPSLKQLDRAATALGKRLVLSFE